MTPSQTCIDLVAQFETFRSKPYLCPAGVPTIGYGSTRYSDGRVVSLKDPPIPELAARLLLVHVLERGVGPQVEKMVTLPVVKQHEFDALCSFAYNVGTSALSKSRLLKLYNQGKLSDAASRFDFWVKAKVGKKKVVLPGLVTRRAAEKRLFLGQA